MPCSQRRMSGCLVPSLGPSLGSWIPLGHLAGCWLAAAIDYVDRSGPHAWQITVAALANDSQRTLPGKRRKCASPRWKGGVACPSAGHRAREASNPAGYHSWHAVACVVLPWSSGLGDGFKLGCAVDLTTKATNTTSRLGRGVGNNKTSPTAIRSCVSSWRC